MKNLGTMEQRTEGMQRQATELIKQAYQSGYKAGYSKAENDYYAKTEDDRKATYELGLDMAWDAARKLVLDVKDGGLSSKELESIFSPSSLYKDLLKTWSASEVIEMLRAYEEKKTQDANTIKVGDEVRFHNRTDSAMFVIKIGESGFIHGIDAEGNMYINQSPENWIKTGRTLPEVAELMNKMRKVEEQLN